MFEWADKGKWVSRNDEEVDLDSRKFRIGFEPLFVDYTQRGAIYVSFLLVEWMAFGLITGERIDFLPPRSGFLVMEGVACPWLGPRDPGMMPGWFARWWLQWGRVFFIPSWFCRRVGVNAVRGHAWLARFFNGRGMKIMMFTSPSRARLRLSSAHESSGSTSCTDERPAQVWVWSNR